MDKMFKNMDDLIRSRNAQKGDELKKKFDERKRKNEEKKRKEDELYEWMAKLNVKDRQKMKRETQGGFTN